MNSSKFDKPELYNQVLLRKLEKGVVSSEDDDFLNVNKYLSPSQKMMDILSIQRRIEIFCSLRKSRNKGETIKNQSTNKIIKYCNITTRVPHGSIHDTA